MKLEMFWVRADSLSRTIRFYRDTLGWDEAWREGDLAMAFRMPGSDVQLMVDCDPDEGLTPGPFFRVESVDAFYEENRDRLNFVVQPKDIPPGRYAAFTDPTGNTLHIYDVTRES
ncbi:MAG: VOC family protein [Firmicutes bacterium]|nr:VOC family protein [Bacillota bacterium]